MSVKNGVLVELLMQFPLRHTDTVAVDVVSGCPLTLTAINNYVSVQFNMNEEDYAAIKDEFEQSMKACGAAVGFKKNVVSVVIANKNTACQTYIRLRAVISNIVAPLTQNAACPYCGMHGCDTAAIKGALYTQMHETCRAQNEDAQRQEITVGGGNYFTGTIGALLGALLMIAIAFVFRILLEISFGWFFFTVTFAAFFGYRLLKGPYGVAGTVIVSVCAVLSFIVMLYGDLIYGLGIYAGFTLSDCLALFPELTELVFLFENLATYWFEFIFFMIGFVSALVSRPLSKKKLIADREALLVLSAPLSPDNRVSPQPSSLQAEAPSAPNTPEL